MPATEEVIARLSVGLEVSDVTVQTALDEIWKDFRSNTLYREEAIRAGLNPDADGSPFVAYPEGAQVGFATVVLIFVATEAGRAAVGEVVHTVWEKLFLPLLEQRFGGRLSPKDDGGKD